MSRRRSSFSIHNLSYKSLFITIVFLLIGIVLLSRFVFPKQKISAAWFNDGWRYRKAINIANATGSNLTNYQISTTVDTANLISSGKMRSDCNDIRVTDTNGTLLDFWVSNCNTNSTQIWPRLPSLPAGGATVYLYYGNPSANSAKVKIGTNAFPGLSCKSILESGSSTGDGNYWIDPTNGDFSDMLQVYCDMTNDSGGWMLTTQSMINSEIGASVTTTKASNTNNGVDITNITTAPSGCGVQSYYKVLFNDIIPWTQIKADYTFTGGNSCWGVFGASYYGSSSANLIPFALGTDTIRNQVKMGGSNGDAYDGVNTRCDNVTYNFWHSNQGVGTTRSAQVILRRNSMGSLAGLGTDIGCLNSGYGWKYQNIFIKEASMAPANITPTLAAEEVSPAPVAYWKFDEGIGATAYDSGSNQNNGVISSATWALEDQCISGKCLQFNGSSSVTVIDPSNGNLDFGTNNFTVEFWINYKGATAINNIYGTVINKAASSASAPGFFSGITTYGGNGSNYGIVFSTTNGVWGDGNIEDTGKYNPNTWYHVTGVRNGSTFTIYQNGKYGTSTNKAGVNVDISNNQNLLIGGGAWGSINAQIDDVKIYPYARTAAQIKSDYSAGKAHSSLSKGSSASFGNNKNNSESLTNGLVSYWKMDETAGTASDSSGNGNTAPVVGSNNYAPGKFGNGLRSGIGTTNLNTNPSVETNSNGWSYWLNSGTGVAVPSTDTAVYGTSSYKSTMSSPTGDMGHRVGNALVSPSTTYSVSGWIKITSWGGSSFSVYMREYYPTGNGQCGATMYTASGVTNGWVKFSGTCTTRADTTDLAVSYYLNNTAQVVYVDAIQIEQSTTPTAYVDGSLGIGYSWTGTAHASTSTRSLSYATSTDIDLSNQFTFSAWVNALDYGDSYASPYPSIITKLGCYSLMCDSGGLRLDTAGLSSTSFRVANTCLPSDQNQWQHIVAVYDGSNVILYKNGLEIGRKATTGTLTQNANLVQLSTDNLADGAKIFDGTTDEIRIYNRALAPGEVTALYNWAPGPAAYYNFDENTGSITSDKSGNNFNGSLGSGNSAPSWTSGKYGSSLNWDGLTNKYIFLPNNSTIGQQSWTISGWVQIPSSTPGRVGNFIGNYSDSPNMNLEIHSSGQMRVYWNNGEIDQYGSKNLKDDKWHYITYIRDKLSNKFYMYIDGVIEATIAGSGSDIVFSSPFWVGSDKRAGGLSWHGKIDDLKIYNYARSQKQITEDMIGNRTSVTGSGGGNAGQIAYYKFDEGVGTLLNNSGSKGSTLNANFGAGTSIPAWTNDGKFNKALDFTTSNSYATVSNSSTFNGSSSFTASAWVKSANTAQDQTILSANPPFFLRISSGKFRVGIYTNSVWTFVNGTIPLLNNVWYHLTLVYDGNYIKSYVNGVLDTNTAKTGSLASFATIYIGYPIPGGENYSFNGLIDEVKIYNSGLTADEVKLDYNRGAATQIGSLSAGTGNSAPLTAFSQQYCVPGDSSTCTPPIAEWNFEENNGTIASDSTGNNNTGTLYNSPSWTSGKIGSCLNFNASNQYIDAGTNPVLNLTHVGTIEAWIKPSTFNTTDYPTVINVGNFGGSRNGYRIYHQSPDPINKFKAEISNTSSSQSIYFNNININNWNHLSMVWDGTKLTSYLNGIQSDQANQTLDVVPTGNVTLSQSSYAFVGKMDQVRVYNYARTPAQIAFDYNRGSPIGWWKLDECQGSIANDSSGLGNTGSISIGNSGSQTSFGTCSVGTSAAWTNGASGRYNGSLNFDGTDDFINVGLTAPQTTFSLEAWIKAGSDVSDFRTIIDKTISMNNRNFWLALESGNGHLSLRFSIAGVSATYLANTAINDNKWHHVVATYNNSFVNLYVDGRSDMTPASVTGIPDSALTATFIGQQPSTPSRKFIGQIDNVRIYNYGLTPVQIKTLYNNGAVSFNP